MSRLQNNRRLSLLVGASVIAAAAAVLAPGAAFAQAACSPGPTTGAGTNNVTYAGGDGVTYDPGITCIANGDMTVNASGPILVSASGGVPGDPLVNGINLIADGAESITWNSEASVLGGIEVRGPTIDALSESGSITINAGEVSGVDDSASTISHAIRAISSGGGDITIDADFAFGGSGEGFKGIGVEARSTGGNGDVSVTSAVAGGRLYGIRAQASGTGALTIATTETYGFNNGAIGVEGTADQGLITFSGQAIVSDNYSNATAVRLTGGGDVSFTGSARAPGAGGTAVFISVGGDLQFIGQVNGGAYGLDLVQGAGGTATVELTGSFSTSTSQPAASSRGSVAAVRAQGAGNVILNVTGGVIGSLDFGGLATSPQINIRDGGGWILSNGQSVASSIGATIDADEGSTVALIGSTTVIPTAITFSGDNDVVNLDGDLFVNPIGDATFVSRAETFNGEANLSGLEIFNNAGVIRLGTAQNSSGSFLAGPTDLAADDILSMPGTRYVGDGGMIVFDVNLNSGPTTSCSAANRNADGNMPSDCVAILDGSTEGTTYVVIRDQLPGDRGAYNPEGIVLVDVSGSGAGGAMGDFVVSDQSPGYSAANGGFIDKGVFAYMMAYDAAAQQHKLVGVPSASSLQFPILAGTGHSLWRLSNGAWLDRQADLRGDLQEGIGGGVWLRASGETADRDLSQTVAAGGQTFTFDNSFKQDAYAVTGGFDLLSGAGGDVAYVAGLMAGYSHADLTYEASPNEARMNGGMVGGYASFLSGGLYIDASISAGRMSVRDDVPAFDLFPAGTLVSTNFVSVGGQVETGWRFPLMETLFVEPLAGVSYVRSKYDDLVVVSDDASRPGVVVEFDDPTSLRAGLGGRVGMDRDFGVARAQFSLLGRMWNEFEGENTATLHNIGEDVDVMDDFSGQFNEVGFGASIYSPGGAVSGFLNLGGRFADDYRATTASTGIRVNW